MTTSREKFEAAAMKQGYALTFSQGTLDDLQETNRAWNIWKEARESMRKEVIPLVYGWCESDNVAQRTVNAIKEIEL